MKKNLFLAVSISCSFFMANAQLSDTKWQGTIKIPMENGVVHPFLTTWLFQKDTLTVMYPVGTLPADIMTYQDEKNVISIRKVSGGVPCDGDAVGKYTYEIKNDQLLIRKLEDACQARGSADLSQPLTRVK